MVICFYACRERTSNILSEGEIHYLENYHCWPYDVSIYSIDKVKIDSSFYNYPLNDYFDGNEKYKITHWTKYNEIDTTIWNGMDSTLKKCDDNIDLYNSMLREHSIYFAGMYRNITGSSGSQKRQYAKIMFIDLSNNRLHIFKDINKIF